MAEILRAYEAAWLASLGLRFDAVELIDLSREDNRVLRLSCADGFMILKIGPRLTPERDRLRWLEGRLRAPCVLGWQGGTTADMLLMSGLPGTDLATLVPTLAPRQIATLLATALRIIHAVPAEGCPFTHPMTGTVLVHGDACLPNILVSYGAVTGFIDLADCGRGSAIADLAAGVWSLDYNLGPGFGGTFLQAYGYPDTSPAEVERLRGLY